MVYIMINEIYKQTTKMKITLAYAPENRAKIDKQLNTVIDTLRKRKQQVTRDPLKKAPSNKNEISKYYHRVKGSLKTSDALIVELSAPSTELGYLVAEALSHRKPVLALASKLSKSELDNFFGLSSTKFMSFKKYSDASLAEEINSFLDFATAKVDTKFILIITPEIDSYLRWKAKEEGVRKAEIVRSAIDDYMQKDKAYKV